MDSYNNAIDWNNIHSSLVKELGNECMGWISQIEIELLELKQEIEASEDPKLPTVVQIKQKFGDLRIYTDGQEPKSVTEAIDEICSHVSKTCEDCGNSADVQIIAGFASRLCCHCYNRFLDKRFTNTEGRWPNYLTRFDVAERWPDLVSPSCASLVPSVGSGWLIVLGHHLKQLNSAVSKAELPPGTIQISDIKTKNRCISLSFHNYHDVAELFEKRLEYATTLICERCGHNGSRNRGKDYSNCLCDYCSSHQDDWDPFDVS